MKVFRIKAHHDQPDDAPSYITLSVQHLNLVPTGWVIEVAEMTDAEYAGVVSQLGSGRDALIESPSEP